MLTEEKKILRGEILRVLFRSLSSGTGRVGDNVLSQVFTEVTISTVQGQLRYLEEKGYLNLERVTQEFSSAKYLAKINSAGIDLLEGTAPPDPAITVPPLG